ncbi:MAG: RidA family protein [Alphaproteobacteria bacterium]|nr:RidA family protein [Alphaproteobacteria bacterium]
MATMRKIVSPHVREPKPQTWSNCKVVGDQVFISGMTAHDLSGGLQSGPSMYEQAKQTFVKIKHLVEAAGGQMDDIVKVNVFVTNIKEREEVWRARAEFFTGDFPCSTLVEVSALATPALKVEIEAVGFIGSSRA